MKYTILVIAALVLCIRFYVNGAGTQGGSQFHGRRSPGRRPQTGAANAAYRRYVNMYRSQFNTTIAKKQGKCKMTPAWSVNATYPVIDQIHKGNAVFLFTMKKPCHQCWHEVRSLNRWAKYYKQTRTKAKIIILLQRKYGYYPEQFYKYVYPYLDFYNEPKGQDIFGLLKAGIYHMLMYDRCGRHQYHYKYPYSSMVKPYVRLAMENTLTHHESLGCGKCTSIVRYPSPEAADDVPPTEKVFSGYENGPAI